MKVRLIQVLRGFTEGGRFDWLHPTHGPFPDFAAIYANETGAQFEVLSWDRSRNFVAAVCGPDNYHHGYPRSYLWWPGEGSSIWCRPNKGKIYDAQIHHGSEQMRDLAWG